MTFDQWMELIVCAGAVVLFILMGADLLRTLKREREHD